MEEDRRLARHIQLETMDGMERELIATTSDDEEATVQ